MPFFTIKQSIFIDTSGFFAIFDKKDSNHQKAVDWLSDFSKSNTFAYTSDYIIDETLTLLLARSKPHLCPIFLNKLDQTKALKVEFTNLNQFQSAKDFFIKHIDQKYSFTDCVSFIVMKELNLSKALTADKHFLQAGFELLL